MRFPPTKPWAEQNSLSHSSASKLGDSLITSKEERSLWVDCIGGLVVGCVVIAFRHQFSDWESLPLRIVVSMGVANLVYGGFSLIVTTRNSRPMVLLKALAIANMLWLLVCVAIAVVFWSEISILGLIHVLGEGGYVALLGCTEWRWRNRLAVTKSPTFKTSPHSASR